MMKLNRFLSFLVVMLMLVGAAIAVNKTIFRHSIRPLPPVTATQSISNDSITQVDDETVIIHTGSLSGTLTGYAGDVPLDIYIKDDKITEIKALPNNETPSFFNRASALLGSWTGKSPQEAVGMEVDGISGATYTSNAIISNVRVGLDSYIGSREKQSSGVPLKIWIGLIVTLAACILPMFIHNKVYHTVQMLANAIVLGIWCGQFLDYTIIINCLSFGMTLPLALIVIVMLVAAFIFPLFGHPQHYCNHICPLGSAQQLAAQICKYKIHIPPRVLKGLDWFRKILWAALMLGLWSDIFTDWMNWELFQAFQFRAAPMWIIIIAGLFIALSAIIARPYCRFICPTGSLFKRSENIG